MLPFFKSYLCDCALKIVFSLNKYDIEIYVLECVGGWGVRARGTSRVDMFYRALCSNDKVKKNTHTKFVYFSCSKQVDTVPTPTR